MTCHCDNTAVTYSALLVICRRPESYSPIEKINDNGVLRSCFMPGVWEYFGHRFDYGASGVCKRCMRRYGSVW